MMEIIDLDVEGTYLEAAMEIWNAVVASNTSALALYKKLGFVPLGVIPNGFFNKDGVYEDIIPHYINLK